MTTTINQIVTDKFNNVSLLGVRKSFESLETKTALLTDEMNDISQNELVEMLKGMNVNSSMISLFYYGDYSYSRTEKGAKKLKSLSYKRAFIGHDYQNKVNARLIAEAKEKGIEVETFVAQKANGLEKISNVLYKNKYGQYRVRVYFGHKKNGKVEQASDSKHLGYFTKDDNPISFETAKANDMFMPSFFEKNENTKGRGALTKNVNDFQINNYSVENILAIAINGKVYRVI